MEFFPEVFEICYEKKFDFYHKILSKVCIPSEKNKMSLFSMLFSVWIGSCRKIRSFQRRRACRLADTQV